MYFSDTEELASSRKRFTVYEETLGNISLFASDASDLARAVAVRVMALPKHGTLFDSDTGDAIRVGDRLSSISMSPYKQPILVLYQGDLNYFNSPSGRYNGSGLSFPSGGCDSCDYNDADTFAFQVELLDNTVMTSALVHQAAIVVNVNDPPIFLAPQGPFSVLAIGAASEGDILTISGITLMDLDRDVDPVKVFVSCQYGFITLNEDALSSVDFNSYDLCYGHDDWSCIGDGTSDKSMLFIGQPSSVAAVLSSITYQSTYSFVTDLLTITVFDGERAARYFYCWCCFCCPSLFSFSNFPLNIACK